MTEPEPDDSRSGQRSRGAFKQTGLRRISSVTVSSVRARRHPRVRADRQSDCEVRRWREDAVRRRASAVVMPRVGPVHDSRASQHMVAVAKRCKRCRGPTASGEVPRPLPPPTKARRRQRAPLRDEKPAPLEHHSVLPRNAPYAVPERRCAGHRRAESSMSRVRLEPHGSCVQYRSAQTCPGRRRGPPIGSTAIWCKSANFWPWMGVSVLQFSMCACSKT